MVLVTGAGGQVGRSLIQALSAKGISVRAWIHREEQKESVLSSGASEIYIGDLALKENATKAMKGTDTVFFICNTANPREDEIGAHLIRTAKELGNITFIYHSVLHSLLSDMPHHNRKRKVEKSTDRFGNPICDPAARGIYADVAALDPLCKKRRSICSEILCISPDKNEFCGHERLCRGSCQDHRIRNIYLWHIRILQQ